MDSFDPPTPSGSAAVGMPPEAAVAVRALSKELRLLEAGYGLVAAAAMHAADAAASATPSSAGGGPNAASPPTALPPSNHSLAMQLQISQHEVELLQDHLHMSTERARGLQAALDQREADLQRAHSSLVEHMRQSGALLGSLANLHQNLVPSLAGSPSMPVLLAPPIGPTTTTPRS